MDENSGTTANDVSGNNNDGTHEDSGINEGVTGIAGTSAYNIDAAEAIDTGVPGKEDSLRAVSMWFKADQFVATGGLFWADDGGWDWTIMAEDCSGSGDFFLGIGGTTDCSTAPINVGTWQLVTVEWDLAGGTTTVWINGTKEYTTNLNNEDSTLNWHIAEDANSDGNGADGVFDNVKFYSKDLSTSYVQDLYNTAFSGSITTAWRSFSNTVDGGSLELRNVQATLNNDQLKVYVEVDTNGDGTVDATSSAVSLDGSGGPYSVSGLSTDAKRFRIRVEFISDKPTTTPQFSGFDLYGNQYPDVPTGPSPSDGAGDVARPVSLSATYSDPDGGSGTLRFYNAANNNQIGSCSTSSGTSCSVTWSGLNAGTTYDWYAVADDGSVTRQSATWSFT
ncbi:MAG: hypothetical protein SVU32_09800, partial [Candidatus Nanohaloarchaea archaeon]|nr:hypothetical protein [Candidatus Nanohaloarchaea archaeon]